MTQFELVLEDLRSAEASLRFSALSRLENLARSPATLAHLQPFLENETDPTIRFYIQLIVGPGKAENAKTELRTGEALDFLRKCLESENPDYVSFFLRLKWLPRDHYQLVTNLLRERRWTEYPEAILPFFLRIFRDHGSALDVPDLELLCRHHNPHVLSLAVEALERWNPDRLESMLLPLLADPNPGIRSQAIRSLARRDPVEARKHFESMLFSPTTGDKAVALSHAFFFPFDQIETALLVFLSQETDPGLLQKAGRLFIINPSPETPLRLIDLFDRAAPEKKEPLKRILLEVIRLLEKGGIIQETGTEFLEKLKQTYRQKKAAAPKAADDKARLGDFLELMAAVPERWSAGQVAALEERLFGEQDPVTRLRLRTIHSRLHRKGERSLLQAKAAAEVQRLLALPEIDFATLAFFLDLLPTSAFPLVMPLLRGLDFTCIPDEILPFLMTIFKQSGTPEDSPLLAGWCQHQDARLLYLAIEALEKVSPEDLKPFLVHLLSHDHPGIRSRTIRFLYSCDPLEAMRHFSGALFAAEPLERQSALDHAFFLPFEEIKPLLFRFLAWENEPRLIRAAGNLIRANPSSDLPRQLVALLEDAAGQRREFIQFLIEEAIKSALMAGLETGDPQGEALAAIRDHVPRETDPQKKSLTWLEELNQSGWTAARPAVHSLLATGTPEEKIPALRRLGEFGDGTDIPAAKKCLSGMVPGVIAAAIEALAALDKNCFEEQLSPFLEHGSAEVRLAVVRALAAVNPRQAVRYLEPLLGHVNPQTRAGGILAAGRISFSLARDVLIGSLDRESVPENRVSIGNILVANMDFDLFVQIFKIYDFSQEKADPLLPGLFQKSLQQLLSRPDTRFSSAEDLIARAREKRLGEEAFQQKNPVYSYANIQRLRKEKQPSATPLPLAISWLDLWRKPFWQPATAGLGFMLLIVLFFDYSPLKNATDPAFTLPPPPPARGETKKEAGVPFEPGQVRDVKGIVQQALADGIVIRTRSPLSDILARFSGNSLVYQTGDIFRGRIKFIRLEKDRWQAQIMSVY
jgi:HEAT repeat protein